MKFENKVLSQFFALFISIITKMEFTSKKTEGAACFGSVTAWGNFYVSFQLDDALAAQLSTRGI